MLPPIRSPAKRQRTPNYKHSRHHSKELLSDLALKKAKRDGNLPFLPLIPDGSLKSFTSSESSWSIWERQGMKSGMPKIKQRGGGFRDHTSQKSIDKSHGNYSSSIPGVKTHDLQLRFESAMHVNKGWSIQNPNPRLLKLQSATGKFNTGLAPFSFRNIDDYPLLKRTLAAPHVEYLYQHKHSYLIEERNMTTNGSTVHMNDRFSVPSVIVPEKLPQISPPPTRPLAEPVVPGPSLSKQDELVCVHKKSCGCINIGEKDSVPSRSIYNRWERKSTSLQRKKSLQSNSLSSMVGGKVRVKPPPEGPQLSPPKIPHRKITKEMSLENLRWKVKKVLKQNTTSQDSLDKRRRSLQNAVTKTCSSKKIKYKRESRESKPVSTSKNQLPKEDKEETIDDTDEQTLNDVDSEDIKQDMEPNIEPEEANDHMNDVLTVVETISTAPTPTSIRRVATPRILKMKPTEDEQNEEKLSSLRKTFKKLDSDGDGHLSFDELKQSLPSDLTKRQLDYLRKIYLLACESTFFGFEEFVAVNQMCDVIANASPAVLEAYETIDVNEIDDKLTMYTELSSYLDRTQTGTLDNSSFKELLASTMNTQQDSELTKEVLTVLNKEGDSDVINSVELLVFIPYLVLATPT